MDHKHRGGAMLLCDALRAGPVFVGEGRELAPSRSIWGHFASVCISRLQEAKADTFSMLMLSGGCESCTVALDRRKYGAKRKRPQGLESAQDVTRPSAIVMCHECLTDMMRSCCSGNRKLLVAEEAFAVSLAS